MTATLSPSKPVQLSNLERAMFDRAVEMAVLKLGGTTKFKNNRVEIECEGDTLKVLRMRPHKLMFKATKTDNGWEPVGFPNVERRDVELLERMNKVESQKFEEGVEMIIPIRKSQQKCWQLAGQLTELSI